MRKSFTYNEVRFWVRGKDEYEIIERKIQKIEELKNNKPKGITVNEWVEEWFDKYREATVGDRTYKDNKGMYGRVIAPKIGEMQITDVRQWHLQEILNGLADKSKAYSIKVRSLMSLIFGAALDNQMIEFSPATRLKVLGAKEEHRRALTKEERIFFLSACENCGRAGMWGKVLYYCGLRPGETAYIKREDIKDGLLHVRGTKTDAADRLVPISNDLALDLLAMGTDPIFQTQDGKPMTKQAMKRAWEVITRQMNILMGCEVSPKGKVLPPYRVADDLVPYCLRHNYATMLQEAGVEVGVASKILGHTDIKTTLNIYTHSNINSIANAGGLLEAMHKKMY